MLKSILCAISRKKISLQREKKERTLVRTKRLQGWHEKNQPKKLA